MMTTSPTFRRILFLLPFFLQFCSCELPMLCDKYADELDEDVYTEEEINLALQKALYMHNKYRAWHSARPMILDEKIQDGAIEQAEMNVKCGNLADSSSQDRPNQGENLYMSPLIPGKLDLVAEAGKAVRTWYKEFCDKEKWPIGKLNHFTQVVWNISTGLGMGFAVNKKRTVIYIAGRYSPQGNIIGQYEKHVGHLVCGEDFICDGNKLQKDLKKDSCIKEGMGERSGEGDSDVGTGPNVGEIIDPDDEEYHRSRGLLLTSKVRWSIIVPSILAIMLDYLR